MDKIQEIYSLSKKISVSLTIASDTWFCEVKKDWDDRTGRYCLCFKSAKTMDEVLDLALEEARLHLTLSGSHLIILDGDEQIDFGEQSMFDKMRFLKEDRGAYHFYKGDRTFNTGGLLHRKDDRNLYFIVTRKKALKSPHDGKETK